MAKNRDVNKVFDSQKMLLSKNSPFSMQEAYKTLRTNTTFSLPGSDSKCIGIISANRGDGKSSIAANLAISFGQINKKVVLVDCDMRLPTIAFKLGVESKPGLSNYLAGECDHLPIQHHPTKNIDIISSGNIPPDPTKLIESTQMTDMIELLKETYDYIIMDFPPIVIVSDAVILSRSVDGYLIVVRHSQSEASKIAECLRQLKFSDAKIIGFVYNGKSDSKKYYKKSRYYRYYKYYK